MEETSGTSYRKDKKEFKELTDEKVRRIHVWRTEVEYSQTHCICSKPTINEPAKKTNSEDQGKGKGKAVVRKGEQQVEGSSSTAMEPEIQPESSQGPANPAPIKVGLFVREGDPCSMCETPVNEGVLFKPIGVCGDEAIICTNASSRSMTSINHLSDVLSYQQYRTPPKAWFKRKTKKPLEKIKRAVTPDDEDSKRKQVLAPLLGLLRRASRESLSSGPRTVRPRATEMYHTVPSKEDLLRAGSVETLLSGLSDDDDGHRRPKLTIDESAARLRRAQRLLEKQKKDESKS